MNRSLRRRLLSSQVHARVGFTLVELLVVIVIIGLLIAVLIPAVNAARGAARNTSSKNNLRQIALAMTQHATAKNHYPSSWKSQIPLQGRNDINGWSLHAQVLPYLEQTPLATKLDYDLDYHDVGSVTTADGKTTQLTALRVPTFMSPSEPRDEVRFENGQPTYYPLNYAVNLGTWLVWDPNTRKGGDGAAYPDSKLKDADFGDGLSFTMALAEVKAWQPYFRNAGLAAPMNMPQFPSDIAALGGDFKADSGHTEWVDGHAHHVGFTTTFRPNTEVLVTQSGKQYDVDWTNWREGQGLNKSSPDLLVTYAAITARGYFAGHVNVAMMDGSTRPINDDIHIGVWQAISTRNGKELLPDEFNKQ